MIELNQQKVNFENKKIIGYDMLNYNNYYYNYCQAAGVSIHIRST